MPLRAITAFFVPTALLALTACANPRTDDAQAAAEAAAGERHVAITTATLEPYECGTITRLHTMEGVFLASQPAPEDLEQAVMGGVKAVIDLRHASEHPDFDERAFVEDLGLAYHNPAFNGPAELTDAVIDEALTLLETVERPAMLHCSSANRVGAIWLAYRTVVDGVSFDVALAEAKTVGLRSPDFERIVRDYVERRQG